MILFFSTVQSDVCTETHHNASKNSPVCHERHTASMQEKCEERVLKKPHVSQPYTSNPPQEKRRRNMRTRASRRDEVSEPQASISAQGGMCLIRQLLCPSSCARSPAGQQPPLRHPGTARARRTSMLERIVSLPPSDAERRASRRR